MKEYVNVCREVCGMNPMYCNKDEKECQSLFDEEQSISDAEKLMY
jgi:hypothetical protein